MSLDRRRRGAARALRRPLRWWLIWGPVRSGTTLMGDLAATHARWAVSDWGLRAALNPPLGVLPAGYDVDRPRRALMTEVLAHCETGHRGPLDLVLKQANLFDDEHAALVQLLGPPERSIFCLRDPAGFMRSAVRKFPDIDLENLRQINYIDSIERQARLGGEVFLYHPEVTGDDYARFLAPLTMTDAERESVRYTGGESPELTTEPMWQAFRELRPKAANAPG